MKRLLKCLIVIALLAVGGWLVTRTYQTVQAKKEIGERVKTLQHCSFESLNGGQIFVDEFDNRKPTVIIYFNPECEHCQFEASEIGKEAGQYAKANMILITPDDSTKRIEAFAIKYHLWEVDNLTILLDREKQFKNRFGTAVFPSTFIYGPDKKLIKMFRGETRMDAIIKIINL
jgi:peroxiredoxin